MKTQFVKTLVLSLVVGITVTLALFGLGYVASARGAETLSYALYWQAYVMYMLLPCTPDGSGQALCENVTAARLTFFSGIPVGVLIYSAAAYPVISLLRRRRALRPPA